MTIAKTLLKPYFCPQKWHVGGRCPRISLPRVQKQRKKITPCFFQTEIRSQSQKRSGRREKAGVSCDRASERHLWDILPSTLSFTKNHTPRLLFDLSQNLDLYLLVRSVSYICSDKLFKLFLANKARRSKGGDVVGE